MSEPGIEKNKSGKRVDREEEEEHKSRREIVRIVSNMMYGIENIQTSCIILCHILPKDSRLHFLSFSYTTLESQMSTIKGKKKTMNLYLIEFVANYESKTILNVTETGIISISMSSNTKRHSNRFVLVGRRFC